MNTHFDAESHAATVVLEDQLCVQTRERIRHAVLEARDQGATRVILDCTRCGYIDSSGLGLLVSLSKKFREASGVVVLRGLNADLREVFVRTHLDTLFEIEQEGTEAPAP